MYKTRDEYENLVKQYHIPLFRLLYGYCGNRCDAEDGVQTAYLRLWQSQKTFLSETHAKNWLYKVAVNYIRDLQKSKWNGVHELEDHLAQAEDAGAEWLSTFHSSADLDLMDAILELSEDYRMVILLYYYEDYSVKEISRILAVKESTIATRLQRAREQLKPRLEGYYGK